MSMHDKTSANAQGTVAVMMCAVLMVGCSTHRKIQRNTEVEQEMTCIRSEAMHEITLDDMSAMISRNENMHVVFYDTDKPIEPETGRPPVKAELWQEKEEDLELHDNKEVWKDETMTEIEHEENTIDEKETRNLDMGVLDMKWWILSAVLLIVMAGIAELKNEK